MNPSVCPIPGNRFNPDGTLSPDFINSILYAKLMTVAKGVSPVSVARYVNSIGDRGARLLKSMKHPELSYNVMRLETDDEGRPYMLLSEEGYGYVCARLKSGELHRAERSDLSKVRDYYRIVSEFDVLSDALIRGDNAKAGRILNRAVRA